VLPAPQNPDGLTIAPTRRSDECRSADAFIPDNGIVERFHKTMLDEFYRIAFRKKLYETIEDLQADLDLWMREFNDARPIRASGASERPPCRPSLTRSRSRAKNPSRSPRQTNPVPPDHQRPAITVRQIK
jgi:hypothetical protein